MLGDSMNYTEEGSYLHIFRLPDCMAHSGLRHGHDNTYFSLHNP